MDKFMAGLAALIGIVGAVILLILYATFSWGYITYKFWYWFILPVFPQLPAVSFSQAIGISIFISLFKSTSTTNIKNEYQDNSKNWISYVLPWVVLLVGYFIKVILF